MELKQVYKDLGGVRIDLLIVPYGIETDFDDGLLAVLLHLLIVPYGIETSIKFRRLRMVAYF